MASQFPLWKRSKVLRANIFINPMKRKSRSNFLQQLDTGLLYIDCYYHIILINYSNTNCLCIFACRGYQRFRENITKGIPDMQEAIDVSLIMLYSKKLKKMFLLLRPFFNYGQQFSCELLF